MITFKVDDMSCSHCVDAITRAVETVDAGAAVAVDLASHRVAIEPRTADAGRLRRAIEAAVYTPMPASP